MLIVNENEMIITKEELKIGKLIINGEEGYNLCLSLDFVYNNQKGYINLSAGYEKENDIKLFINKEYKGIPFDHNNNEIGIFEVFDTQKFFDTEIESEIKLILNNYNNNQIHAQFEVCDELINIKYDGSLTVSNLI